MAGKVAVKDFLEKSLLKQGPPLPPVPPPEDPPPVPECKQLELGEESGNEEVCKPGSSKDGLEAKKELHKDIKQCSKGLLGKSMCTQWGRVGSLNKEYIYIYLCINVIRCTYIYILYILYIN